MKQAINFLSVYQDARPVFSAKHVLLIWGGTIIFMALWYALLLNKSHNEQAKLEMMQSKNTQYATQLRTISNQFRVKYGQSLSDSIKSLTEAGLEKEQRLKEIRRLKKKGQDLTYYLNKIAEDHVAGTLIDFISIEKGQRIKMTGRSITPQLVPKILSSWENVNLNSQHHASQFKIQKMQGDEKYVNFVIQVQ